MSSFGVQQGGAPNKITKSRGRMVKPILKKLSHPHSEKTSLDLDREWDEQAVEQLENSGWAVGYGGGGVTMAGAGGGAGFGAGGRDGAFGYGAGDTMIAPGGGSGRAKFQHGRSASQASTGSGTRVGFVHPFAQTPRTSTPPLSYANSLASFDNGRDCSPTITENDDDDDQIPAPPSHLYTQYPIHPYRSASPAPLPAVSAPPAPSSTSQSGLRRPSLASSQRTSSFPDAPPSVQPPLRINTGSGLRGASVTAPSSRLANLLTPSQSDLHSAATLDSPTGSILAAANSSVSVAATQQMSPLRSSLELVGFPRLRSRSELDTASRAENIRAARRKFEERERAKEEKYDREMIKKRERRDTKEASRIEKGVTARKSSTGGEMSEVGRPSMSRRTTPTGLGIAHTASGGSTGGSWGPGNSSRHDLSPAASFTGLRKGSAAAGRDGTGARAGKAGDFASRQYESVPAGDAPVPAFGPTVEDVRFEQTRPRRGSGAKRRTHGYWQGFLLWLRTKLLRIGGR